MVNNELQKIIRQQTNRHFVARDERVHIKTPNARQILMRGLVHFCGGQTQWLPEYDAVSSWLENNGGRGILCYGNCGRGKSLITQRIMPVIFQRWHGLIVNNVVATELANRYQEISQYKILSIDDVGTEDIANRYGEKHDYFREIVDLAERKQKLLLISTNFGLKEIAERYGERTIDRLRAITTTVQFKGGSLRGIRNQ